MNGITTVFPKESIDTPAKKFVISYLQKLNDGYIELRDNNLIYNFGDATSPLKACINVNNTRFYSKVLWGGSIGFAEAYILGDWDTNDLTTLLQICALNLPVIDAVDQSFSGYLVRNLSKVVHYFNRNSFSGSEKNISKHYDLGNEFFSLFLDPTMLYSAACFVDNNASLYDASVHKMQLICNKLQLNANDTLLEIGCGWGSFAIYAAQKYGCHVTATTISQQQYNYTKSKVKSLGLESKINVLMQDYRVLQGTFDKLVSIEMVEAVGHQFLGKYIATCNKLLKNGGIFVLQAIVVKEQRYTLARDSVDFIKKYIFPGGFLPSIGEIVISSRTHSDFNVLNIEDLTMDYATTLRMWRESFIKNSAKVLALGFDEIFIRKWLYYLCYCEAGFLERTISSVQMVLVRSGYRDPEYNVFKTT